MTRTLLALTFLLATLCASTTATAQKPQLLLAKSYNADVEVKDYWISEKYDGVRAFWNGKQLLTRQGNIIKAPTWFIQPLSRQALDGELWIARQQFEVVSGIVRKHRPTAPDWQMIHYMVFDLPSHPGTFSQRLNALQQLQTNSPAWMKIVPQWRVSHSDQLMAELKQYTASGAEGLMLHRANSHYRSGLREGFGLQAARPPLRVPSTGDKACALKHLDVFGYCRLAHVEGFRQLFDRRLSGSQPCKDGPPGRVGKGGKGKVQTLRGHLFINSRLHHQKVI